MNLLQQIILGLWGILPGNYSGITAVGDGVYAIVDDKDQTDGFKLLTLSWDTARGKVKQASLTQPEGMTERRNNQTGIYRDCEGIAYFPEAQTLFVTGEADQRILEYSLEGRPTGRELAVPAQFGVDRIVPNLGFEALSYNAVQRRFWTTTEATLKADGPCATAANPEVINHLRLLSFDDELQPSSSYIYAMEPVTARKNKGQIVHGVPSLIALDDGRLLVMEREAYVARKRLGSFVRIKLFLVDPSQTAPTALDTPMTQVKGEQVLKKTLVGSFTTRLRLGKLNLANYEGMCLGPKLPDGRQTLLLIADSQNGSGNRFFHLKDYIRIYTLKL